jgi:hypothetical protein
LKTALEEHGQGIEVGTDNDAKVAGGNWRFEEATPITICAPANPTDPGDAADPSTPQGILVHRRIRITIRTATGQAFFQGACFAPPDKITSGAAS